MSDCGCNPPKGQANDPGDFTLYKATSKSASKCGTPEDFNPNDSSSCTKQDKTYDKLLSDFSYTNEGSFTILVCNGSLYAVGQWIQLMPSEVSLRILSISGNEITVTGSAVNSVEAEGNPNTGKIIRKEELIYPIAAPETLTDSEKQAEIEESLKSVEELAMPSLKRETSDTAKMDVVGWVSSDSGNSSFKNALKRVAGVFFQGKVPFLTNLKTKSLSDAGSWRRLVINSSTKEVAEQLSLSEDNNLQSGKKYIYGVVDGKEGLVEGMVYKPIFETLFEHGGNPSEAPTWVNIPNATPLTQDINMAVSGLPEDDLLPDTFYANILFRIGCKNGSSFPASIKLEIDNEDIAFAYTFYKVNGHESVCLPIAVSKANKQINLRATANATSGNGTYHVSAKLKGIFF